MGKSIRSIVLLAVVCVGCGTGEAEQAVRVDPVPFAGPQGLPVTPSGTDPDGGPGPDSEPNAPTGPLDLGTRPPTGTVALPEIPSLRFQPGFHQALRWTWWTEGKQTFRFKVPVTRAGNRIRVAFRSGDGPATVHRASVARAGNGGHLASPASLLLFDGDKTVHLTERSRALSDPLPFTVKANEELYVTLEGEGAFAASAIDAFPDSWRAPNSQAFRSTLYDEVPQHRLIGVTTIDVEGAQDVAFVALGDSITEGYVSGADDARLAWPHLAATMSGRPVVNAAVSGQGLWGTLAFLGEDVLPLEGVTDCMVLLGTNDLGAKTAEQITGQLEVLFDTLAPKCRVWAGTLLPKERTTVSDLQTVNERRRAVNAWIRNSASVHAVVDFEQVVRDPADPDAFLPGLDEDGIHPSREGQKVLGQLAAQFVSSTPVK